MRFEEATPGELVAHLERLSKEAGVEEGKEYGGYYEKEEWDHVKSQTWNELTREEVAGYDIVDDRDGNLMDPEDIRIWLNDYGPGEIEFQVILYRSGLIEIGDEGTGVAEEGGIDLE